MTSRKKRRDDTKGAGYLAFLKGPPIKSEGDVDPKWYGMMSNGLAELNAQLEAERAKQQMVEMLSAAPLPAPTAASSTS